MTNQHGVYLKRKGKKVAYKDLLKRKILELEEKISVASSDKEELEKELQRLLIAEFEEEMATENSQSLLKG